MGSETRDILVVDVMIHFIDESLFSSSSMLVFVYEMIISMSEYVYHRHTMG